MDLLIGTAAGAFDGSGTPLIEGTRINHIARDSGGWWLVDGKGRVHHNGEMVAQAEQGISLNCIQPTHDTVFVGATEAKLFELEKGTLQEDDFFADAPTRESWYTPWGGPPDVRSMAVDVDGSLYINVHVGGILRYDNTGLYPTIDYQADVHQVVAHPKRPETVLAATAFGLARSSNGHDFVTTSKGLHSGYCRAVAVADETIFISASTGPSTTDGRIYRTTLADSSFVHLSNGLPDSFPGNVDTHCIVFDGKDVFVGFEGTVWTSPDRGDSWSEMVAGLPKITCLA